MSESWNEGEGSVMGNIDNSQQVGNSNQADNILNPVGVNNENEEEYVLSEETESEESVESEFSDVWEELLRYCEEDSDSRENAEVVESVLSASELTDGSSSAEDKTSVVPLFKGLLRVVNRSRSVIIYCPSMHLEVYLKGFLKERLKVHSSYVVNATKYREFIRAKRDSFYHPHIGDKWLVHFTVDTNDLSKKEFEELFDIVPYHGVAVYWVRTYRDLMRVEQHEIVSKNTTYFPIMKYGRVDRMEYNDLCQLFLPRGYNNENDPENYIPKKLLEYVYENYSYDLQAILSLFSQIRSGEVVTSPRDVVELIGVSGASVGNFVMMLLQFEPKVPKKDPEKYLRNEFRKIVNTVNELTASYKPNTIRKFMLGHLDAFMQMKRLQYTGFYKRVGLNYPNHVNGDLLDKNRRYKYRVLKEVNLTRILKLRLCLEEHTRTTSTLMLLSSLTKYLLEIQPNPNAKVRFKKRRKG